MFHLSNFSQSLGNEWINYNQQYFHFPIVETGIYRLDFETISNHLINSGVSISNIPHNNFQVFGKEKEVSLLVKDNNNNGFLEIYSQTQGISILSSIISIVIFGF